MPIISTISDPFDIIGPLTISGPTTFVFGDLPVPQFTASGGLGTATYEWTASGGTFDFDSGVDTVNWTPPSKGLFTICVTDGVSTACIDIFASGSFPADWYPSEPVEATTEKTIVSETGDTGSRIALRKSKPFRSFSLRANIRDLSEFYTIKALWEAHYPDYVIVYSNTALDVSNRRFYFDSPLREQPSGTDLINYSFVLKDSEPITYSAPPNNHLPFTPEWGHEVDQDKAYILSDAPSRSRKAKRRSEKRRAFKIGFEDRLLPEFLTLENFWCYHYPGKLISLNVDLTKYNLHLDGNFWITSNLKWTVTANTVSYEFEILEA